MKVFPGLTALFVVGVAQAQTAIQPGDVLPNVYIVEFADDNVSTSSFYDALAADGVDAQHRMDLSFRFFNGVSFQVKLSNATSSSNGESADVMSRIKAKSEVVRSIWPVRSSMSLPEMPESNSPDNTTSTPQSRIKRQEEQETRPFSPHVMTQIDKLHAEGITGTGVQVAIIDSGVDYTHPALGGCLGENCLVRTGYDFVGDNFRLGVNEPVPDDDPMDDCFGHGTHVAGTVAAQLAQTEYGFSGGAPGVRLAAYRIWNCISGTSDEIQLAAFARAVEDGADIISYSNGFQTGWGSDVLGAVASRIAKSGIMFAISAGNDGGLGLFYPSSPSTGKDATAVGAVSNTKFPVLLLRGSYQTGNATSDENSFPVLAGSPEFPSEVKLSLWSAVDENNACNPLPNSTDLTDTLVLLQFLDARATGCYPPDQGNNIAAKNGKYMLYYDGSGSNLTMRDDIFIYAEGIEGVARIPPYVAEQWLDLLAQGLKVEVTIPGGNNTKPELDELENNETGGYLSNWLTSWGPSWELNVKPNIVAPGENILSTYLTSGGSYRVMTGTSMAAPLLASAFALIKQAKSELDPDRLLRRITTTSKPLAWHDGKTAHPEIYAPVPQQGSGIVQAWDAVHATAELSIGNIAWNDTDHFDGERTFSVLNTGSEDLEFTISHDKAVTMYTMQDNNGFLRAASNPNPIVEDWANIQFDSTKITVPAGQSTNITLTCTPPSSLNTTLLPVYSGFIRLTPSSNTTSSLILPYLGVAGSMRSTPVSHPSLIYLASYNNPIPANTNTTCTIPRPDPSHPPATDSGDQAAQPNIYMDLLVGTPLIHIDVLEESTGKELGAMYGAPLRWQPRGQIRVFFTGLLADGTVLGEGRYKLRIRVLRIFGREEEEGDWDVVESGGFGGRYE